MRPLIHKAIDEFNNICKMWLSCASFAEMSERTNASIADIEDVCSKTISYELSFFIGNIVDLIEVDDDKDTVDPYANLNLLQRKIKYGVNTETAVSICEKIFNDRYLASLLTAIIGHDAIGIDDIIKVVKHNRDNINSVLSDYPTYFADRVKFICGE